MERCDCFACTASDEEFNALMRLRAQQSRTDPDGLLAATRRDLSRYDPEYYAVPTALDRR